ncbi:unnamed protein product [Dovyalis caffra]|uniref:Uncharacterized protein n=1 Tax=Dovyalis caffra TaxID=77055 RepID=A0AAV1QTZ9_9ROSI|nr:unnamed protein product [Dovyalis caffra]
MDPPPSLSNVFHDLSDTIKKFLASNAVSDFIHMISDLIKKILASDAVVSVVKWCKKEKTLLTVVAVAIIGLLMLCCCCKCLTKKTRISGKTMKAPGQDFRMLRNDFEASPSAYFRNLRSK